MKFNPIFPSRAVYSTFDTAFRPLRLYTGFKVLAVADRLAILLCGALKSPSSSSIRIETPAYFVDIDMYGDGKSYVIRVRWKSEVWLMATPLSRRELFAYIFEFHHTERDVLAAIRFLELGYWDKYGVENFPLQAQLHGEQIKSILFHLQLPAQCTPVENLRGIISAFARKAVKKTKRFFRL